MKLERSTLYDILIMVLFVGILYGVHRYFSYSYDQLKAEHHALEQEFGVKRSFQEISNKQEVSQFIQNVLPADKEKSQLTATISQLARQSNIEISRIEFAENDTRNTLNLVEESEVQESDLFKRAYKSDSLTVQVTGSEAGILDFIHRLQKEDRLIDIMQINYSNNSTGNNLTTGTIVSNIYYR